MESLEMQSFLHKIFKFFILLSLFWNSLGCVNPTSSDDGLPISDDEPLSPSLATIVGTGRFSTGTDHSGIVISLEPTVGTTGLLAASLIAGNADVSVRALTDQTTTNADGEFRFDGIEPGEYVVYASHPDTLERAVRIGVTVTGATSVTVEELLLTPTGSVSGRVINSDTGALESGWFVYVAGTSYLAVTATDGTFTISDIPVAESYAILTAKGSRTFEGGHVSVTAGQSTDIGNISVSTTVNDVRSALATGYDSFVIFGDGSLWVWGDNNFGDSVAGTHGVGDADPYGIPRFVLSNVRDIDASRYHMLVVTQSGELLSTGWGVHGQLGDGTTSRARLRPVMTDVVSVAAGSSHSLALKSDGTLWTFGSNSFGQLGTGNTTDRSTPIQVMTDVVAIGAGYFHSMAVRSDDTLWAFGANSSGQLGDGTTTDRLAPVQVLDDVASVAVGLYHTLVVRRSDSSVWSFGSNSAGQLGDGTTNDRALPVAVGLYADKVAVGSGHSFVIDESGQLYGFGSNLTGALGDGTLDSKALPVLIRSGVREVSAGGSTSLIVLDDGSLYGAGRGNSASGTSLIGPDAAEDTNPNFIGIPFQFFGR
jgi:alpha-tubulin suppressor-like RCC1 family protein